MSAHAAEPIDGMYRHYRMEGIIMYAIGIKDGVIRCGNDGMVKLNSTSPRKIIEQTKQLRRKNDAVYIVSYFTQAMCEMSHDKLLVYIARTGSKIK